MTLDQHSVVHIRDEVAPPLINIDLGYVRFGLAIKDHIVIDCPPVAQYCLGWTEERAVHFFEMHGATVTRYPDLRS